jgi:hypothetical protein
MCSLLPFSRLALIIAQHAAEHIGQKLKWHKEKTAFAAAFNW